MRKVVVVLLVFTLVAVTLATLVATGEQRVVAAGPCGTPHDALDADELEFIAILQTWRDANLTHTSATLVPSAPLNAAAAWQAQYLAENPFAPQGHIDGEGRNWAERAEDCGYDSFWAYGSGEGVFALAGSGSFTVSPAEAVDGVIYPGSGATADFPSSPSRPPFRCVGVARATNANSTSVAWIVVLAQFPTNQECPQALTSGPTATPTATTTPTPSPTPTPTPAPTSWSMWAPGVTSND